MKETEIYSIINKINELQLVVNTYLRNNDFMENAEKKYGFKLSIPQGKKHYIVRYKNPDAIGWLDNKTSTGTSDYQLAVSFAIENKDRIIKEYKQKQQKRKKQTDKTDFYQMLNEYYTDGSKYLRDDSVNKKRDLSDKLRIQYLGSLKKHFIPFFTDKNINSIQEITPAIYSALKIHLTEKLKKETTINNVLTPFNRILHYHERNELIAKLPYGKGLGSVRDNKKGTSKNDRFPLPTEYIKNIFTTDLYGDWNEKEKLLYLYLLGIIGLTTGMRNSEIARIQRQDIYRVKETDIYILKAYNHKTKYYNTENDEYRKIPLHPFVVMLLKFYISEKEKETTIFPTSYLFGLPKINKDGKIVDGCLHSKVFDRAIKELYKRILIKQRYRETGKFNEAFNIDDSILETEMKKKHITFYSLRHTFQTLFALYGGSRNDESGDLIDYFAGHKPLNPIRANYTHINKVDDKMFYDDYGKNVINMLNKYIFYSEEEKQIVDEYTRKILEKLRAESEHLFKDGRITMEDAYKVLSKHFNKEIKENVKNDDDMFDTI